MTRRDDMNNLYPDGMRDVAKDVRYLPDAKIISIGYSVKFLVPGHLLVQTVELLQNLQKVEGYEAAETLKPIEYEVKTPDPNLGVPISDREKRLSEELEKKNSEWATAYNKVSALEKELKALRNE
jgi:hypothetical protein